MKLHFELNLDCQHAAIESECDLFHGQEICRTEFTSPATLPTISSAWVLRKTTLALATG